MALVYMPIEFFVPESSGGSMLDLSRSARVTVLYEESSPTWINYHDALYFFPVKTSSELQYLWGSEKSGYFHLYIITSLLKNSKETGLAYNCCERTEVQLTNGDWMVLRGSTPVVDEERGLLYFVALKDNATETHVYVTSYTSGGGAEVRRLTPLGCSHSSIKGDRSLYLNTMAQVFVDWHSSLTQLPTCDIYRLRFEPQQPLPTAHVAYGVTLAPEQTKRDVSMEVMESPSDEHIVNICTASVSSHMQVSLSSIVSASTSTVGNGGSVSRIDMEAEAEAELIEYCSENSGRKHYAVLYRPFHWQPDKKYPVLLHAYGGPEVQMVRNVWPLAGFRRLFTSIGYAVVIVDGRGSSCRGHSFEAQLKCKMGTIEVDDQVEGLEQVARRSGNIIDLERVAIFGWSYGGYLALHALAQRPDVFKVAIAGGPVTTWHLYDTGYTERYMGIPQQNMSAYRDGSVIARVSDFPDEPGRLLILHGLIDENVHFQHTAKLVEALVRAGKPYHLQVFPKERHGVRSADANEHMDATILFHLQQYL